MITREYQNRADIEPVYIQIEWSAGYDFIRNIVTWRLEACLERLSKSSIASGWRDCTVVSDTPGAAFFEAGHAIGACLEGISIERQYFYPEDEEVWTDVAEPILRPGPIWKHTDRATAKSLIRALLAGPAAQDRFSFGHAGSDLLGCRNNVFGENVVWRAIDLAGQIKTNVPQLAPLWRQVSERMNQDDVWLAVTRVADSLFACRELAGCEIEEIVRYALPNLRPGQGFRP